MTIQTGPYFEVNKGLPERGQHLIAHHTETELVVYQAYNPAIADFALEHQYLGGSAYSYNRMSWIKPNFLWMMYRCGWASKQNQERVLALWISRLDFELILKEAVFSSFRADRYSSQETWKQALSEKEVRLQWDPDHDPFGAKQKRRAIQLGMKGAMLQKFGRGMIRKIEDITDFVREQKALLDQYGLERLLVPQEAVVEITDPVLAERVGIG
jgi:hypothetical protein